MTEEEINAMPAETQAFVREHEQRWKEFYEFMDKVEEKRVVESLTRGRRAKEADRAFMHALGVINPASPTPTKDEINAAMDVIIAQIFTEREQTDA